MSASRSFVAPASLPAGTGSGTVTHSAGALTANRLVVGNGLDDVKSFAPGTAGQVLGTGTPPAWVAGTPWIDVRDYGAKCDGVTVDNVGLQAALDQAAMTGTTIDTTAGARLVMIPGPTVLTTTLTIRSGTRLVGQGPWATQINASGIASGPVFQASPSSGSVRVFGIGLDGMKITGPGRAGSVDGFVADSGSPQDIEFDNVWFTAVRAGITLTTCEKVMIHRSRVSESQRGLYVTAPGGLSTTLTALASHFDQNEQGAYLSRCDSFQFIGTILENNTRATALTDGNVGCVMKGVGNSLFLNNHWESNTTDLLIDTDSGGRQSQFNVFDKDVFNPATDNHISIVVVDGVQQTFRNIRGAAATTVYLQIYNAVTGTVIQSADAGGTGGSIAFKNQAGTVVTIPPGSNSLQMISHLGGWKVVGGFMELTELAAAPAAPATGNVRFYAISSGGKTQFAARFPTGAVQQIAIEP